MDSKITFIDSLAGKMECMCVLLDDSAQLPPLALAGLDQTMLDQVVSAYNFKGHKFEMIETMLPTPKLYKKICVMGVGDKAKLGGDDWLTIGAKLAKAMKGREGCDIVFSTPNGAYDGAALKDFMLGIGLASYQFDKYKTTKKDDGCLPQFQILTENSSDARQQYQRAFMATQSVNFARDLVNEPANIMGTLELAAQALTLKSFGVAVEILDEVAMKDAGMAALLAVNNASARPARLVVMRWQGGKNDSPPIAFLGKGVVFDSGGISIKPAQNMEEMKGDMAGAAAVIGAMRLLAERKVAANVVGIIGVVENMVDGGAQRPGDVVQSMSGQTIEVINTDAEGRLVLADLLCYTRQHIKPRLMIDLATLTGAIMVALGSEYAGLFANDDQLANQLTLAGNKVGEKVWRMPLDPHYDSMIDSKVADMRNSCGRLAGAITAAQFLQRFVGDTPWAHIDIAGTAMGAFEAAYLPSWATGFGVRLLDCFVDELITE